ncbi:MAG: acyloxyacyl hydrolase [Deltaproteobacteria bacterium]|nr:acyloxyacyl hydrolase [Deltaproteobacteria bacterium]
MKSRRWRVLGWMMAALVCGGATPVRAADLLPQPGAWAVGLRTGYSIGTSKHVEMVPVNLRIGYTLFKGQKWFLPPGALEVAVEPFASVMTSIRPKNSGSLELGAGLPMFSYYFNLGNHLHPYIEGGLGVLYTDLRGYHLGGHFSFLETAGAGVTYFLNDNLALNAGWRYRHISNASLYAHNVGLNSGIFLAGFSYFLPPR